MRRFLSYGPGIIVLLTVTIVFLAGPILVRQMQVARIQGIVTVAQHQLDSGNILEQINSANRAVADASLPSVVHIESRMTLNGDDEEDDRFRFSSPTSGAGWVYDNSGHLITNAHVVEGADSAEVEFYDGRVRNATIVGLDRYTDVAVLKIDSGIAGVIPFRRATDEALSIGEQVYAFGSPFGIKFSMTRGIVSGLGRTSAANLGGLRGSNYTNYIQTDAAINPGNSGGPLVDIYGRVVGMNTAIANNVQTMEPGLQGQSAGIGFAVPLETIESVADQIIDSGFVIRGYLGINIGRPLSPEDALAAGFDDVGVLVEGVPVGQPARKSGLQRNDIIVSVAGRPTPDGGVLRAVVSVQEPGSPVAVRYWREGEYMDATIRLGGAYHRRGGLRYVEGSEAMSLSEIRRIVRDRL